MPDDRNRTGRFEPIHDAHAIEQVAFVIQFSPALDDGGLAEVRKLVEPFTSELPGRKDIQALSVSIRVPGLSGLAAPSPIAGSAYSRTRPDGTVESELRVDQLSVTFRTVLYTRWDAVWQNARRYFDAVIAKYVSADTTVAAISLTFFDKFLCVGTVAECRPSLLLRPNSRYVCPHVFSAPDLWHSHTGAFLRVDEATKRLLNVNVDYLEENQPDGVRRVIAIATALTDLMNQPGYVSSRVMANDVCQFLDTHMKQLHHFGKEVFGNVVNDDMSKRIALTG